VSNSPLGNVATVDEPDQPCVPLGGTKAPLFGVGNPARATHLAIVAGERLAATENLGGFFTFGLTGATPAFFAPQLGPVSSFGSEGTNVAGVAAGTAVLYQRYDVQGNLVGPQTTLAPSVPALADGVWIGSGGGISLAAWAVQGTLYAGGVTSDGASAGPAWIVAQNVAGTQVAISYARDHFGLAWSIANAQTSQAFFVLADPSGPLGSPVSIASGGTTFEVTAMTATPAGFALLAVGAGGDNHAYVLPLDATGQPVPPAHRLLGADQPWAIAAFGNELGVVVSGNDVPAGESGPRPPLFRPLDSSGHALGPWVCLDVPVPKDQYQNMAIDSDLDGYSVVYQSPSNQAVLARFDHLGTGAPSP
jgi:hypothetical protein